MNEKMDKKDLLEVKPQQYLKGGFLSKDNEFLEGINGQYSMAMAYRCLEVGTAPETVHRVVSDLEKLGSELFQRFGDAPDHALDSAAKTAIDDVARGASVSSCQPVSEIFKAAHPHIKRFRDVAALALHLERIAGQMAMIGSFKAQKRDE